MNERTASYHELKDKSLALVYSSTFIFTMAVGCLCSARTPLCLLEDSWYIKYRRHKCVPVKLRTMKLTYEVIIYTN